MYGSESRGAVSLREHRYNQIRPSLPNPFNHLPPAAPPPTQGEPGSPCFLELLFSKALSGSLEGRGSLDQASPKTLPQISRIRCTLVQGAGLTPNPSPSDRLGSGLHTCGTKNCAPRVGCVEAAARESPSSSLPPQGHLVRPRSPPYGRCWSPHPRPPRALQRSSAKAEAAVE